MNLYKSFVMRILALLAAFVLGGIQIAAAATFDVTEHIFEAPGGFRDALIQANANPGPDIIEIKVASIYWATPEFGRGPDSDYGDSITVTDALTINGNGARIYGDADWVTTAGNVSPFIKLNPFCPTEGAAGDKIIGISGGFLQIGRYNADNSNVNVTVNDLTIEKLSSISKIRQNASLTLHNVQANRITRLHGCHSSLILADHGASFAMEGGGFFMSQVFYTTPPRHLILGAGPSATRSGKLSLKNVNFNFNDTGFAASWQGPAEITSSQFSSSGGFDFTGGPVKITNSLFFNDHSQYFWDRLTIWNGTLDIVASTFLRGDLDCANNNLKCNWVGPGFKMSLAPFQAGPGGVMNIKQSILAVQWTGFTAAPTKLLDAFEGGRITSDDKTFIQPVTLQSADDLKALTGQPNLITDPPGLPFYTDYFTYQTGSSSISIFVPELGTFANPSKLIDAILFAEKGAPNELLAPDGTFIATDAFGNPRVDTNNRRNIGAVQTALAPRLYTTAGDAQISALWFRATQTLADPITHYELCYYTSPLDPSISTCPGKLQSTLDADKTSASIDGLTNGTRYWVTIRAVTATGNGPWSNVSSQLPYTTPGMAIPTATPGDGQVALNWTTPSDGGTEITIYLVMYREVGSPTWIEHGKGFLPPITSTVVSNLKNGVPYEFKVIAWSYIAGSDPNKEGLVSATPSKPLNLAYPTPINVYKGFPQTINPATANLLGNPTFSGALPTGMTLDPTTGAISVGAGTVPGNYAVTIQLSQSGPLAQTTSANLMITVIDVPQKLQLIYPDLLNVPAGSGPYTLAPSATGFTGPISYSIVDGSLAPGLTLDPSTGIISGTPTTATSGVFTPTIRASAQNGSEIWQNLLEIEILPVLSYPVANPTVGSLFTLAPNVSPSVIPGSYSVVDGALPPGMALNPTSGIISGTPTSQVSSMVKIQYLTGTGHQQKVAANVSFSPTNYPIGLSYPPVSSIIGQSVNVVPTTSGTIGTTSYRLSGQLPTGLTFNPTTGAITGTPTGPAGSYSVQINLSDQYMSTSASTTITVQKPVSLAYPNPIEAYETYAQTVNPALSNQLGTAIYSITSGTLPNGMSLDAATGVISGTPAVGTGSVAGTPYSVTITLSQASSPVQTATATLSINVLSVPPKLQLIYPDLLNVHVGSGPYSLAPSTTGFTGPVTYSITDGVLPTGLALDPNTGIISGTPTTATSGIVTPTIRAEAKAGTEVRQNILEIEILPLLAYPVTNAPLGLPFSIAPSVSPSLTAGSYSIISGNLPQGLSLNSTTGVISGSPSSPVSGAVTIQYQTGNQSVVTQVLISISGYTFSVTYPPVTSLIGSPLSIVPNTSGILGSPSYKVFSGNLPTGVSLNPTTGAISGTPTGSAGVYAAQIIITDQYGAITVPTTITVQAAPISPPPSNTQPASSIPTLSEYGLMFLSGLILLIACWKQRKVD